MIREAGEVTFFLYPNRSVDIGYVEECVPRLPMTCGLSFSCAVFCNRLRGLVYFLYRCCTECVGRKRGYPVEHQDRCEKAGFLSGQGCER